MEGSTAATSSLTGFTLILACLMASCGGNPHDAERASEATASYLGQEPPGETPESFAPGIVNTDAIELNGVVSPDGREFFFTRVIDDVFIGQAQPVSAPLFPNMFGYDRTVAPHPFDLD